MGFSSDSSRLWRRAFPVAVSTILFLSCGGKKEPAKDRASVELTAVKVPGFYSAAEAYFSPDGRHLIMNARLDEGEEEYHVYTTDLAGTEILRINDKGDDACSYFFPDGRRLIFTSTRDNLQLPHGDYSRIEGYPTGAELYTCDLDGSNRKRLTNNEYYDAEVSVSPDGKWVLFSRLIDGRMDLWRMRPDGSGELQITDTEEWQEGGAFYLPDSEHIIFRAWKVEDQHQRPIPMTIYTIKQDGTELHQITTDPGLNWSPYPSPDGRYFLYVRDLPPHNFEVFLMNVESREQIRVTYNEAFDAYPSFSPDGKTINFSSNREDPDGRLMSIYIMDISSLLDHG